MIATFFVLAAAAVVDIVVDKSNRHDKKQLGDRVDRACRWAFPATYAAVTVLLVVVFSAARSS